MKITKSLSRIIPYLHIKSFPIKLESSNICSNFEITYLCFIFILVVLIWWFCIWFYTLRRNFYIVVEPLFRSGVLKVVLWDDKRGRYRDGEKVLQMNGCLWRSSCNLRFGIKVVWVLWKQSRQNFCMIVHQACIIMQALPLVDVHSPKSFQTLFFPFLLPLILSTLFPKFCSSLIKASSKICHHRQHLL